MRSTASAVYQLHKELPPPDVDDPELLRQIIEAAIADIASMLPANGDKRPASRSAPSLPTPVPMNAPATPARYSTTTPAP